MIQQEPDDRDDEEHCDEGIDPEGPSASEMDYSDEPDLEICPHCRKLISEESEQCPHCMNYVSLEDSPMPRWAWVGIAIGAITLLAFALMRL